jgi:hypothetical protein
MKQRLATKIHPAANQRPGPYSLVLGPYQSLAQATVADITKDSPK